jgi:hypothetical protein
MDEHSASNVARSDSTDLRLEGPEIDARGVCPYCGERSASAVACERCQGLFEPLSKQATQNAMGPWFVRDEQQPFRPGCSYATVRSMALRGKVKPETVLRGPSTRQFWMLASRVPGIGHLFGACHSCEVSVGPSAGQCPSCGASFAVDDDRQFLGLAPARDVPGASSTSTRAKKSEGSTRVRSTIREAYPGAGPIELAPSTTVPGARDVGGDPVPIAPEREPEPEPEPEPSASMNTVRGVADSEARLRAVQRLTAAEANARRVLVERRERERRRNMLIAVVSAVMLLLAVGVIVAIVPGSPPAVGGAAMGGGGAGPGGPAGALAVPIPRPAPAPVPPELERPAPTGPGPAAAR